MPPIQIARRAPAALAGLALGALVACSPSAGDAPAGDSAVGDTTAAAAAAPSRLADATDQFLDGDGARLRYRVLGAGEPVVLLHGLGSTLDAWQPVADSLAATHRVILLDQRGHGGSSRHEQPAEYGAALGEDVVRLLDHLGVRRAHLVGHSLGAIVASSVAVRHPDRVATVSLVAPPFYEDSATAERALAPFAGQVERGEGMRGFLAHFAPELPDSLADRFAAEMGESTDRATFRGVFRSFGAISVGRAGVSASRVPALVVAGGRDMLLAQDRALAGWWPGSRFVEVPEADHVGVGYHPATLAAIREQLGRAPADPGR